MTMNRGIALVELVVIIVMMILLALMMRAQFSHSLDKTRRDSVLHVIVSLAEAAKMYKVQEGDYPPTLDEIWTYLGGNEQQKYLSAFAAGTLTTTSVAGTPMAVFCVKGAVDGLSPTYTVQYCVEENSDAQTKAGEQPMCDWGTIHGFQSCEQGL